MRQFIRHPTEIPIEVRTDRRSERTSGPSLNVSLGGLAFRSDRPIDPGVVVEIRIPHLCPMFESSARVVWCSGVNDCFDLGVEFLDADDAFRARMVEQVCHIETYKDEVLRSEGRSLSVEEAASEWIAKFAASFPASGPDNTH